MPITLARVAPAAAVLLGVLMVAVIAVLLSHGIHAGAMSPKMHYYE
jgi:hypothetical protein